MTDKEKILKGFEELNAIIEPYKNKRNYNKLCLMLKFWAQNFKRSLLWKKAPANNDLELEKELNSFFYPHIPWGDFSETERDDIREWSTKIAKHFAAWQMQQLMKNVVLETEVLRDSDGDGVDAPYESWLTLANTEIPELPENLGLEEGDKVKILIVKSE